jgi:hypothetical protein
MWDILSVMFLWNRFLVLYNVLFFLGVLCVSLLKLFSCCCYVCCSSFENKRREKTQFCVCVHLVLLQRKQGFEIRCKER